MPPTTKTEILNTRKRIIVDLHVDPLIQHFLFGYQVDREHGEGWQPKKRRWLFRSLMAYGKMTRQHKPFFNHIDFPRMRVGGYTFGAFGIHSWPRQSERSWQLTLRQLDYFRELAELRPFFSLARTPDDIAMAAQHDNLVAFPGVEGTHCLGAGGNATEKQRLDRIELLQEEFGVGYLTLCHLSRNDAACPRMGLGTSRRKGLSEFGKALVKKLNQVGIIVDLAHVNDPGILDACEISQKPVIVSHTGLKGIYPHKRNLGDQALKAVAHTGGLVGIMFGTNFLSAVKSKANSDILLNHIDYAVQCVGEDHVAIGSDFDGWIASIPTDMRGADSLPVLIAKMENLGYSEERIRKILGENFIRVWREVKKDI